MGIATRPNVAFRYGWVVEIEIEIEIEYEDEIEFEDEIDVVFDCAIFSMSLVVLIVLQIMMWLNGSEN
ncbi:hypothetical protein [Gelidibacter salicanalis]|uniref:hypothetical protein n=1 Tax=Gelidibacter salicanalis TaxID=291193 RepID=UPI0014790784|nr:hypothetical protein [Gelidibacter salicanalis]